VSEGRNIFAECHANTLLVELFGYRYPNHSPNNYESIRQLLSFKGNTKGVSLIDREKEINPLTKQFDEVKKFQNTELGSLNLVLFQHKEKKGLHAILLNPAIERWVWSIGESISMEPSRFQIQGYEHFRKMMKSQNARQDQNLKQFLNALKQKNPPAISVLSEMLKTLS
jgi:hypothetical protein